MRMRAWFFSAPIAPGSSGGPIFNDRDSTSQAWTMRYAFDALLDVIARKQQP
jgi:V8-like Glu-specific endopeptidase